MGRIFHGKIRIVVFGLVLVIFFPALLAADDQSDMTLIKGRLYDHFLDEGAPSQSTVQGYLDTLQPNGSWPDINYNDHSRTVWDPVNHLYRIEYMSKAYRTVGHYFYNSSTVLSACSNALDYYYSANPWSDNWWWNEIGQQLTLKKPLILLETELTSQQISDGCALLDDGNLSKTGQNRVWAAEGHTVKALLQMNASNVSWALDYITSTILLTTSEGIQPDYSYQMHDETLYSGGYGAGFTYNCSFWANVCRGTFVAFTAQQVDILSSLLLDGQQWMTRGRMWDPGVCGRGISRKNNNTVWEITRPCQWYAELVTARQSEFLDLYDQLAQVTPADQPPVTGNRQFWHSDYMTHLRNGYFMSTRMYSTRNYNTDGNSDGSPVNGEGLRSHHIADGCTYIHLTGEEYFNIFGVWDWYRIPGTTVEYGTSLNSDNVHFTGLRSFVGGVSDGTYGMAAFDFEARYETVEANKAWFYFDTEVVCLGADIDSSSSYDVLTSMDQRLLNGTVTLKDSQGQRTAPYGSDWTLNSCQWVHHNSIGYVYPSAPTVRLKAAQQSNTWGYINDLYSGEPNDTKDVFSLWINHGSNASNATYQYIVVPDKTYSQISSYAASLPVSVRSNTASIQSVEHAGLGIIQAAFYSAGTVTGEDGTTVTVDQPCLVMLRELTAQLEISICNPVNQSLSVNVDINRELLVTGATWMPGSGITRIAFSLPSGWDAGMSEVRVLDEVDNAEFISSTIPSTMVKGQIINVDVTMKNNGRTVWSRDDGHKLGGVGDNDPFASTRHLLPVGISIQPDEQHTFSFTMTAPGSTGTYLTDWQMVHEGLRWFGDIHSKNVIVQDPPFDPPVITLHPQSQIVPPGGTGQFSVSATGQGTITYQWYKGGGVLNNGGNISGATTATVQISNVQAADEGDYHCVVSNEGGSTPSDTATLTLPVIADFDLDNDVDQEDFGHLQECMSGSLFEQNDPDCQNAKLDGDDFIDLNDFLILQRCMKGPNIPVDPNCDD